MPMVAAYLEYQMSRRSPKTTAMKRSFFLFGIVVILLTGCGPQYAYFQSPFHANTSGYKTIPLQKDSVRSAIYASGIVSATGVNYRQRDGVYAFHGSIYRSHSTRHFQGYYGLTGSLGAYQVNEYKPQHPDSRGFFKNYNYNLNDSLINTMAGGKFFGGWGATGGFNFVAPFHKSEWRFLGVEAAWQQEFGSYLSFRNKLPDTAANLNSRFSNNLTLGLNSEIVFYRKYGSGGFKFSFIWFTHPLTLYDKDRKSRSTRSGYEAITFHRTHKHVTGFMQIHWGNYAFGTQLGMNYRLGR
jgi:hypothetical protein